MLTVTIDITGMDAWSDKDRILIQADAIRLVEDWLYAVAGDATITVVSHAQVSQIRGTVEGTFNSLVSPYMYESLDNNVFEFKRIWTADINVTVSED